MLRITPEIETARRRFRYRGDARPEFAHAEAAHEESVWDYPRPPIIVPDVRLVQVFAEGTMIADSRDSVRVLETGSPPVFYLPPDDVEWDALVATDVRTTCEWKGIATAYDMSVDGERIVGAAWSYHEVFPDYKDLLGWVAFYPSKVSCFVERETVYPQPGGYYGGWVTREIIGPFKGAPGTEDW
jgi:uncharacterized protein (DUF427 family)